jgi:hypothetical protein
MSADPIPASTHVQPFTAGHVAEVAELHRRVFRVARESSAALVDEYERYFSEVFLKPPAGAGRFASLVYCEGSRITGFLGVTSRPMFWNGEPVQAAVSSQFVVDPGCRGPAGVQLLRTFFNGPQDISIADESNADSRRLWESLGGATSLVHSMSWICPLRPCRLALWAVRKKQPFTAPLTRLASPAAAVLDASSSWMRVNPFRPRATQLTGEDLEFDSLADCLARFTEKRRLRPRYDDGLLRGLLTRAERLAGQGRLRMVLVKSARRETVGWYIYSHDRDAISDVLQIFACRGQAGGVLDRLAHDAAEHGVTALRGRCEPMLAEALGERHWPCQWGPWLLIHSRRRDMLDAFQQGNAFFSPIDGEWCLHFR